MFFSKQKNPQDGSAKKPSTLRFLFSPEIGNDVRPMSEAIKTFVNLIALIFASNGLFPKDHPALANVPGSSLTVKEIICTAYGQLHFTREGLPKVILFFAVVGCLAFSALATVTAALLLMSNPSHAMSINNPCTTGMFSACSSNDISVAWIDYLFNGGTVGGSELGQTQYLQKGLKAALSFYSGAVLVLAGIILMYHLLTMIAETAHTGKPMGRANQIWAPIRLVVAIGLLVPVASGGLNVGQAITVHVAKWGAGLADHVWSIFSTQMANLSNNVARPATPKAAKVIYDVLLMKACGYEYTTQMSNLYGGSVPGDHQMDFGTIETLDDGSQRLSYGSMADPGVCGTIVYPMAPSSSSSVVSAIAPLYSKNNSSLAKYSGTSNGGGTLDAIAKKINLYNQTSTGPVLSTDRVAPKDLISSVEGYQADVKKNIGTIFKSAQLDNELAALINTWISKGWAAAGAWFTSMSTLQGQVADAVIDSLPKTTPPNIEYLRKQDQIIDDQEAFGVGYRQPAQNSGQGVRVYEKIANHITTFYNDSIGGSVSNGSSGGTNNDASMPMLIGVVFKLVNYLGSGNIWPDSPDSTEYQIASVNPFAELSMRGHGILHFSLETIQWGMIAGAGGGLGGMLAGSALGAAVTGSISLGGLAILGLVGGALLGMALAAFSGFIVTIGGMMGMAGLSMAFILPIIPFFHFFMAVMTWLIIVLEAVVSMPLFALAHLSPHGDGLPGGMAQKGYFFLLSILLRPALTVLGLIAGLLLFYVAVLFLNDVYSTAVAGNVYGVAGFATLSKLIYTVIYAVLAYTCANTCFKTISHFPNHSINWMGQQGPAAKELGDKGLMSGAMREAGGFIAGSAMANLGHSMSRGVQDIGGKVGGNLTKGIADKQQTTRVKGLVADKGAQSSIDNIMRNSTGETDRNERLKILHSELGGKAGDEAAFASVAKADWYEKKGGVGAMGGNGTNNKSDEGRQQKPELFTGSPTDKTSKESAKSLEDSRKAAGVSVDFDGPKFS